jgi:RNA 2',3'-cyclic 3'-phosphodiesterase
MRLFVAVDLDEPSRAAVAAEQERLRRALRDATPPRWTNPDQIHLTLAFLGEVQPPVAAGLQDDFRAPLALDPFDLVLAGLGVFPPRGAPRALWICAREGASELHALHRAIAGWLTRRGIPLESRPFSPHLTIARWKTARPSDRGRVLRHASDGIVARLRVDHATLYQSRVSSAGAAYTELARATLTSGSRG